jgi:hypothetical protein
VNPVERRILELAGPEPGQGRKNITAVHRKVVIPNQRYSWHLFEFWADTQSLESIILDVSQDEAIEIDRSLVERFSVTILLGAGMPVDDSKEKGVLRWNPQTRLGDR